MVNPEMIIIGTSNGSETGDARELISFYEPVINNPKRVVVSTWEEAECIKIFYNTFISTKICFVNMIQDVAESIGNINTDVVTIALKNSTQRIISPMYMHAGMGDGGGCHPRDNIALSWFANEADLGYDLFKSVMRCREIQASNLANKLIQLADTHGLDDIWIHGKAYKPGVEYTHGSYSLLIAHYILQAGRTIKFVDPLTGDRKESIYGVVLLAHQASITYDNLENSIRQEFYCLFEDGSVILDPWRQLQATQFPNCSVIHYGNTRFKKVEAFEADETIDE